MDAYDPACLNFHETTPRPTRLGTGARQHKIGIGKSKAFEPCWASCGRPGSVPRPIRSQRRLIVLCGDERRLSFTKQGCAEDAILQRGQARRRYGRLYRAGGTIMQGMLVVAASSKQQLFRPGAELGDSGRQIMILVPTHWRTARRTGSPRKPLEAMMVTRRCGAKSLNDQRNALTEDGGPVYVR